MTKENVKYVADVHVLLIQGNRILLLKRQNTGFEDGKYSVIAGRRNEQETIRQTAAREALEEAGISILPEQLRLVHVMQYLAKINRLGFFFLALSWEGEPANMEPHLCKSLDWFQLDNLPPDMIAYVQFALEHHRQNIPYSEFPWSLSTTRPRWHLCIAALFKVLLGL